jgi:hypothetical protein
VLYDLVYIGRWNGLLHIAEQGAIKPLCGSQAKHGWKFYAKGVSIEDLHPVTCMRCAASVEKKRKELAKHS